MATPIIVNIIERPRPKFKRFSWNFFDSDLDGAFSKIPIKVFPIEDTRNYIHGKFDEYDHQVLKT